MTRKKLAALAAVGVVVAGLTALGPATLVASSHREAPLVAADPAIDNTDLYAFVSPDRPGYVTLEANFIPFEEPNGGPNFYPFATDAAYNINVDSNGDAKADATFRWTFQNVDKRGGSTFLYNKGQVTSIDDPDLLFRQTYTLQSSFNGEPFRTRVDHAPVAPSRVGKASMPDYAKLHQQAVTSLPGGWKIFAGQADDPFFLDLRVFDLLYGGDLSEVGQDTLAGYNVNTLAIQVPFKDVALNGDASRNPVIGIWTTADRPHVRVSGKTAGAPGADRVQVSRLGNPLVNEVVVPANLKDAFNALPPSKDASIAPVVARVKDPELPKLIESIYDVKAPAAPRNDLVEIFLTGITTKAGGPIKADLNSQLNNVDVNPAKFRPSEMLRLNLGVKPSAEPNRLGVLGGDLQGFPNGRRLTDDVVDIELQALMGAAQTGKIVDALATGDKVNANDNGFGGSFPYVALPNTGAVNGGGGTGAGTGPTQPNGGQSGSSNGSTGSSDTGASMVKPSVGAEPAANLAANSRPDTSSTVTTVALSSAVAVLGAILVGWLVWRRRSRNVAATPPSSVESSGSNPDEPVQ